MASPTVQQSRIPSEARGDETLHVTVMGPNLFETYPLPTSGSVRIGRDEEAEVRITDDLASRLHARLGVERPAKFWVEDLGSSNGTFVRGERLTPGRPVPIQEGEALTIGVTHIMVQRRRPATAPRRVHGHGAFEERLEDACGRAANTGGVFSVMRVQINDEQPAGAGVDLVGKALRPGDFLAQYSPGDYEVLLLDTDFEKGRALSDAVSARVRAHGLAARTVIAVYPTDGRSAEGLIGRATALLRGSADGDGAEPVLRSGAMQKLYRLAERAAGGHTASGLINVLVLGETGSGKEVLADWIHRHSPRAGGPFISINCGALTDSLLESELFGFEKGAHSTAMHAKPGLLEAANGGTVFLDEIGDMPATMQTKLLRALESRQVLRLGSLAPRSIDVRFVAATHRDLEKAVAAGTFRQDLYFRLNGISLTIPPLRERPEEIEPLAQRFLLDASSAAKRRPPRLAAASLEILQASAWPGNIRELRNTMERALVLAEGDEITPEHLPVEKLRLARPVPEVAAPSLAEDQEPILDDEHTSAERQQIVAVLGQVAGNQTRAAKVLGISRGTLIKRLKRLKIQRPQADE